MYWNEWVVSMGGEFGYILDMASKVQSIISPYGARITLSKSDTASLARALIKNTTRKATKSERELVALYQSQLSRF